jgi:hypothetical protein
MLMLIGVETTRRQTRRRLFFAARVRDPRPTTTEIDQDQ